MMENNVHRRTLKTASGVHYDSTNLDPNYIRSTQTGTEVSAIIDTAPSKSKEFIVVKKSVKIFLGILAFRTANALLVQTYFNPDEYWQGPEIAHRLVFGFGYVSWEWREGLRGYLHPLLFAALYRCLTLIGCDSPWSIRHAPALLQGVFAAIGDMYLYKTAIIYFSSRPAGAWALACVLLNWFSFFCATRTFSSSLEASLSSVALYFWLQPTPPAPIQGPVNEYSKVPDSNERGGFIGSSSQSWSSPGIRLAHCRRKMITDRQVALWIAGIACVVRPTSAILWLYMAAWEMLRAADRWCFVFLEALPIGSVCLASSLLLDRWLYGRWVFVHLNFFVFNFATQNASVYGTHPWHWYFSLGFPAMLGTLLPLAAFGIWHSQQRHLAGLVLWTLAAYSCQPHKEFRFVLPVLPVALAYAGYGLSILESSFTLSPQRPSDSLHLPQERTSWAARPGHLAPEEEPIAKAAASLPGALPTGRPQDLPRGSARWGCQFWLLLGFLVLTQVGLALYFSLVHQRGSIAVMPYLAEEAHKGKAKDIFFLMPCHSTPFYSHIHMNVPMTILDCSPRQLPGHLSQSSEFLADPPRFLEQLFNEIPLPSHLVMFDLEESQVAALLSRIGYVKGQAFFHAHFPVDRELQNYVVVYTLAPVVEEGGEQKQRVDP